jgi:hypothetical protein
MVAVRLVILSTLLILKTPAYACGWWGDSEMSSQRETAVIAPDGRSVEHTLNLKNMKLPGKLGYGIAVPEPGRAIPYLLATFGQPLNKIRDLKIFGFRSVIDLGTPASTAQLHRIETQAVGMRYFNIPVDKIIPEDTQVDLFIQALLGVENTPLLVYARDAQMIAGMWASYRLKMGSTLEFSLYEGRELGLTPKQEANLRKYSK